MVKKIAWILLVASALWLGGGWIVRTLASDETKIRWRLEEACEGFDDARANPVMRLFALDFVDETSGFRRDELRQALVGLYFTEKDASKSFPLRASIDWDALLVRVDGERAHVEFSATVTDTRGDGGRKAWSFDLQGEFVEGDDGWQLVRSTHATSSGSWRMR